MGATSSISEENSNPTPIPSTAKTEDLVVRDHTYDYDLSGIEYLKAHQIPHLFQDLTERLLSERPLDSLRFIRNILIHKVTQQQDHQTRTAPSPRSTATQSQSPSHLPASPLSKKQNKEHGTKEQLSALHDRRDDAHSDRRQQTKQLVRSKTTRVERVKTRRLVPARDAISDRLGLSYYDEYDADKLLASRTTKRTRSYSDSAVYSFDHTLPSNHTSATDVVSDELRINVNQLSKPIGDNRTQSKSASATTEKKQMSVVDTISTLMDEMSIKPQTKATMLEQLNGGKETTPKHNDDHLLYIDTTDQQQKSDTESTETQTDSAGNNSKKSKTPPTGTSFGGIASKFQSTFKSLSTTAKSKWSKNALQNIDETGLKKGDKAQSEELLLDTLDGHEQKQPFDFVVSPAPPLRRSRTMESLLFHHEPLRHILSLSQRPCFGFDIGGSLAKVSFFEPARNARWNLHDKCKAKFVTSSTKYGTSGIRDKKLSFPWRNGTFHFIHFQTHRMFEAVSLFKSEKNLIQKNEIFYATGGGAHKYSKYLTEELSVRVQKGDELKCLISGLNFLLTHVSDECYYLSDPASKQPSPKISWNIKEEGSVFPYLLVNVGSGVSILKVDSPTQFERVSGTQIGGGTYWGLCRLCSYCVLPQQSECEHEHKNDTSKPQRTSPETLTFKKAFELAMKGNAKKVNMLVSDIYGGDYPQCNLPGDLVASAFGKCISIKDPCNDLCIGDIARGLLDAIAMNCAQLAYLNAMRFKITRILFAGNFLRQNDLSMAMISYAIHYWSQGVMKACFLRHEGYFGSIGVMLLPDNELQEDEARPQNVDNEKNNENDDTTDK